MFLPFTSLVNISRGCLINCCAIIFLCLISSRYKESRENDNSSSLT